MKYKTDGNNIMVDEEIAATCDQVENAVDLLNKAVKANDSRKYTKAARLMYQAEQLPGFSWRHLTKEGE